MTSEHLLIQGDALRLPFADESVDLVFGSPPYMDARLYLEDGKDLGIARDLEAWVAWMLEVTEEALRVSRGAVVWVASGMTRKRNYQPACECLMSDWYRKRGHAYRPCYWRRVGIPGSGGDQWFRADVEYVMCFKRPGKLPWSNNKAMGKPPKFGPGGEMSHRVKDGARRNQWGKHMNSRIDSRRQDGTYSTSVKPSHYSQEQAEYFPPAIANPGSLIDTGAGGGGNLGSKLAHENEAPFPEALAEHFILSLCPPGGIVLDCFSGSATSIATALKHGRHGIGLDLRRSQCELGARRVNEVLNPLQEKPRKARA